MRIGGVAGGVESKGYSQGMSEGVWYVLQGMVLTREPTRGPQRMSKGSSDMNGGCILG